MDTQQNSTAIIVERQLAGGSIGKLGSASRNHEGWKFIPAVCGRKASRKRWPTFESCLPKWVGYPHACKTRYAVPPATNFDVAISADRSGNQ